MQAPSTPTGATSGRLIGVPELSEWLGISEVQVREWVRNRAVPVTRIDSRVRFDVVAIEKWLAKNTEAAA